MARLTRLERAARAYAAANRAFTETFEAIRELEPREAGRIMGEAGADLQLAQGELFAAAMALEDEPAAKRVRKAPGGRKR